MTEKRPLPGEVYSDIKGNRFEVVEANLARVWYRCPDGKVISAHRQDWHQWITSKHLTKEPTDG